MSYGSAQTRRSDAGRGGAPAMSATVAAATSTAPVSLPRVECIACSLRKPSEGEEVAKYYTRCRSGVAPAPGALHLPTAIGVTLRLLTTPTHAACRPRC